MKQSPRILVIDAQGGGIGKQLVSLIRREIPEAAVTAVGTNNAATAAMMKAGADTAATGENAVVVNCRKADYIVGPVGIAIADSMNGEISPAMALAVAQAPAKRLLIPFNQCDNYIVGASEVPMGSLVGLAVEELVKMIKG